MTLAAMVATLCALPLLHPLIVGSAWAVTTAGAVALVALSGAAGRVARVPASLLPLLQGTALLCYAVALSTPTRGALGFLPTPQALTRLSDLVAGGWRDIYLNPAPVSATEGITLILILSVGLLTLLVDFAAVVLRAPAATGLAPLGMLIVSLSVHYEGVSWLAFSVAALGFLAPLAVDTRLRTAEWGPPVADTGPPTTPPRLVERARTAAPGRGTLHGLRLAALALAAALLLPLAIPGLAKDAVFVLTGGYRGGEDVTTLRPLASLRQDLDSLSEREVLEYRTSRARPEYLRMYALDTFDGVEWTMSPVRATRRNRLDGAELPPPPGRPEPADELVETEITVAGSRSLDFLALPYPPREVEITGSWFADPDTLMVFSPEDEVGDATYTVRSAPPAPTREELAQTSPVPGGAVDARYREVPDSLDPRVTDLTRRITAGATSPHERAVALQDWFTGGRFDYSLRAPDAPSGTAPLSHFLFDSRTGYCEQFAASMAVMARVVGIPARVAVGYTPGERVEGDRWRVTESNAHAWPELYFEGHGWLRFEPTPSSTAGQPTASVPGYAFPAPAGGSGSGDAPEDTAVEGTADSDAEVPDADTATGRPSAGGGDMDGQGEDVPRVAPATWTAVTATALAVTTPALPMLLRRSLRWLRWRRATTAAGRARAAWLELRDDATDAGMAWDAAATPRAVARWLLPESVPASAREALVRIALAEERRRYAPEPDAPESLATDNRTVRRALRKDCGRGRGIRAILLPRSLTTHVGRSRQRGPAGARRA